MCTFVNGISRNNSLSSDVNLIETGGALIHIEKSAARLDFRSCVFSNCRTLTATSTSTNIAPSGSTAELAPFEPLWQKEIRIGAVGLGMIILNEETSPSIKANGIQFVNCDAVVRNIYGTASNHMQANS